MFAYSTNATWNEDNSEETDNVELGESSAAEDSMDESALRGKHKLDDTEAEQMVEQPKKKKKKKNKKSGKWYWNSLKFHL